MFHGSILRTLCFFSILTLPILGCSPPDGPVVDSRFAPHAMSEDPNRPAWINTADLDQDGDLEAVVSVFSQSGPLGAGYVGIYDMEGDMYTWTMADLPGSRGTKFPNDTTFADVDHDGDLDIILGSGFLACAPGECGALSWYENLGASGWDKHVLVSDDRLFYHRAVFVDFDGDGEEDLVTVAEFRGTSDPDEAKVQVFKGTGSGDYFETTPATLADGLGSLPTVTDLDQDGDLDVVASQYFVPYGSAAWLERVDEETWVKHIIADDVGPSIMLDMVPDMCGDGALKAVLANHVNTTDDPDGPEEAVYLMDVPTTYAGLIGMWPKVKISEGIKSRKSNVGLQGAPGIFDTGDPDGDGDLDVVVHGDGDPNVYLLEQVAPCQFETSVLMTNMPQGSAHLADLNGDGTDEIMVTSFEYNRLYMLEYVGVSD